MEYWEALKLHFRRARSPIQLHTAAARPYANLVVGTTRARRWGELNRFDRWVQAGLTLRGQVAKQRFCLLSQDQQQIEAELGFLRVWSERPDRVVSFISCRRDDADAASRGDWRRQHDWLQQRLEVMQRVLVPRVRQLQDGAEVDELEEASLIDDDEDQ